MLDEKARKNIFNCLADKVEDDGKERVKFYYLPEKSLSLRRKFFWILR